MACCCVGPLGLGTLIVKPERHVISIADLDDEEATDLGPLLRLTAQVARTLGRKTIRVAPGKVHTPELVYR